MSDDSSSQILDKLDIELKDFVVALGLEWQWEAVCSATTLFQWISRFGGR
jgi:hypothetical protein